MFQYAQEGFHIPVVTGLGKQRVYCFTAFTDIIFWSFSRCLFPDSKSIYGIYLFWESFQLLFWEALRRIFLRSDVELCIYAALDMIRLAGYRKLWEVTGLTLGNQPWIFIGRTDAEAEAPVFWPPDMNSHLTGNQAQILGKIEGKRRKGWQRMRWLDGIIDTMGMSFSKLWEIVKDRETCHATVHGITKSWMWLSN